MTLRHRVELDAAVLGSGHLKDAEMLLTQNETVGVVVDHYDIVVLGKAHQPLVGLAACPSTRRHIGIVGPHQLHARQVHALQLLKIRLPTVILAQVVVDNLRTEDFRQRRICRISGIRHQHLVARIHESQRDMQDTLLRTYQRQHLGLRVKVNIIPTLVECRHGLTQLRRTHRRLISVCSWLSCHLTQFLDGLLRWWHVRTANGQTDNVLAFGIELCHFFQFSTEVVFLYQAQPVGW